MIPHILKLDTGGLPVGWITWQSAVTLYSRERVVWEAPTTWDADDAARKSRTARIRI